MSLNIKSAIPFVVGNYIAFFYLLYTGFFSYQRPVSDTFVVALFQLLPILLIIGVGARRLDVSLFLRLSSSFLMGGILGWVYPYLLRWRVHDGAINAGFHIWLGGAWTAQALVLLGILSPTDAKKSK